MLQALGERDIAPGIVAGSSVGSLNGAVVAQDPKGAANRLSHFWARLTRGDVFPGGLATVITDFLGADTTFANLALPFAAVAMGQCHRPSACAA